MNKGHLVSFEGQDASGKTELLYNVDELLRKRGWRTKIVEEFSTSEMGSYLSKLLSQNKFLRFSVRSPSALTETMYILSDLYYQDELEIKPSVSEGRLVLKERHIDTIFACQIPKIEDDYPQSDFEDLYEWIQELTRRLHIPDLTFLLSVPRDIQIARIEKRGERVSEGDLKTFDARDEIYRRLVTEHQDRILVFESDKSIKKSTEEIVAHIESRLNR